eukprot:11151178-Karenia_brevis.AAC.1
MDMMMQSDDDDGHDDAPTAFGFKIACRATSLSILSRVILMVVAMKSKKVFSEKRIAQKNGGAKRPAKHSGTGRKHKSQRDGGKPRPSSHSGKKRGNTKRPRSHSGKSNWEGWELKHWADLIQRGL